MIFDLPSYTVSLTYWAKINGTCRQCRVTGRLPLRGPAPSLTSEQALDPQGFLVQDYLKHFQKTQASLCYPLSPRLSLWVAGSCLRDEIPPLCWASHAGVAHTQPCVSSLMAECVLSGLGNQVGGWKDPSEDVFDVVMLCPSRKLRETGARWPVWMAIWTPDHWLCRMGLVEVSTPAGSPGTSCPSHTRAPCNKSGETLFRGCCASPLPMCLTSELVIT